MTLRRRVKDILVSFPLFWNSYQASKTQFGRLWLLRYFLSDMIHVYRHMCWNSNKPQHSQVISELLFQYHKIEKGLVMPGPRRFFAEEPVRAVIKLLSTWHVGGWPRTDPVYLGALEALQAYKCRLEADSLDKEDRILSYLDSFLAIISIRASAFATPQSLVNLAPDGGQHFHQFQQLALARRSIRSFSPLPVPSAVITSAVAVAQLSPTACNRQPCRVYSIGDEARKAAVLALQNGNRGFGHLIPILAVITSDSAAFFNASERHEPYVDGGLFSMSLMYALTAQGLATCCLNWCVAPDQDKALRRLVPLADSERVVMLMAIGYPDPVAFVPRSTRKATNDVLIEVA